MLRPDTSDPTTAEGFEEIKADLDFAAGVLRDQLSNAAADKARLESAIRTLEALARS